MPPESEFTRVWPDCPNPELWSARDVWASEYEVGEFLFGLIRLVKPKVMLETGCYKGDTTLQMARAAKMNGVGHVYTCDINPVMVEEVTRLAFTEDLPITCGERTGENLAQWIENVNLAFIDGAGRREECAALRLAPGAFVLIHDARWPIHEHIGKEFGWNKIFLPCPRGMDFYATGS